MIAMDGDIGGVLGRRLAGGPERPESHLLIIEVDFGTSLYVCFPIMKIGLLQLDPVVGDLAGNGERLLEAVRDASSRGARILLGSELGLIGYPPRDLLLREGVVEACGDRLATLAGAFPPEATVLVGLPRRSSDGSVRNAVALCRDGRVECFFDKRLLPTYDVFDELRHFTCGDEPLTFDCGDTTVGVLVCEDLWRAEDVSFDPEYAEDPVDQLADAGCDLLLVSSASPFVVGKRVRHLERLSEVARRLDATVVSVNQVGGNDDVIFAGGSVVIGPDGALLHDGVLWEERIDVVDLDHATPVEPRDVTRESELFHALRLGLADYCRKTGHRTVALGLSGGIDSALAATIAAAAIGPEQVIGYLMPSRYSSEGSLEDARALAANLGLGAAHEVGITDLHDGLHEALTPSIGAPDGIADENLQSRLRGLLLMAHSNQTGSMVLATGNKSELAVGYCTLYGDMCGGVAVLGDLLKTDVFALSRWINDHHQALGFETAPIPVATIEKPPSAELRPDQLDEDSLPPYEDLDRIIALRIEEECSQATIVRRTGLDPALVSRFVSMFDRQEFKRHQAAVVLKISQRAFGRGRPMPIAGRWVPGSG